MPRGLPFVNMISIPPEQRPAVKRFLMMVGEMDRLREVIAERILQFRRMTAAELPEMAPLGEEAQRAAREVALMLLAFCRAYGAARAFCADCPSLHAQLARKGFTQIWWSFEADHPFVATLDDIQSSLERGAGEAVVPDDSLVDSYWFEYGAVRIELGSGTSGRLERTCREIYALF